MLKTTNRGLRILSTAIIGNNVTLSKENGFIAGTIKDNVTVWENSSIPAHITVEKNSYVTNTGILNKDIEKGVIVTGQPARVIGLTDEQGAIIKSSLIETITINPNSKIVL